MHHAITDCWKQKWIWGDGEWIRTWAEDAEAAGARLVVEPVMANGSPDGDAETACAALGTALANA